MWGGGGCVFAQGGAGKVLAEGSGFWDTFEMWPETGRLTPREQAGTCSWRPGEPGIPERPHVSLSSQHPGETGVPGTRRFQHQQHWDFLFFFFLIFKFIYLFLAALGLRCCARAFSSCGERGLLFVAVRGLLIAVASLVAEHGL